MVGGNNNGFLVTSYEVNRGTKEGKGTVDKSPRHQNNAHPTVPSASRSTTMASCPSDDPETPSR